MLRHPLVATAGITANRRRKWRTTDCSCPARPAGTFILNNWQKSGKDCAKTVVKEESPDTCLWSIFITPQIKASSSVRGSCVLIQQHSESDGSWVWCKEPWSSRSGKGVWRTRRAWKAERVWWWKSKTSVRWEERRRNIHEPSSGGEERVRKKQTQTALRNQWECTQELLNIPHLLLLNWLIERVGARPLASLSLENWGKKNSPKHVFICPR